MSFISDQLEILSSAYKELSALRGYVAPPPPYEAKNICSPISSY